MPEHPPSSYAALFDRASWPLSQLYHENSKLSPHLVPAFAEQVAAFGADHEALRRASQPWKLYPTRPQIELPRSSRRLGGRRLRDVLRTRRTRRGEFSPHPVTLRQWGALLEQACGLTEQVTHPQFPDVVQDLRAWPSGGALYPLEVYLTVLASGELERAVHHYQPQTHRLAQLAPSPDPQRLQTLVYADGLWPHASALLVLTAVFARTQLKYGERGYRFVLLDAGHLAQNLLLVAEDLGLAAIPLGGFDDNGLGAVLGLDAGEESPLYAILVGVRGTGRHP